jgi:hypothetical protein
VRWFRKNEEPLFRTHHPPFRAPDWAVGRVVQHEGKLYRITRWEDLPPVHVERGGFVSEWQIWGLQLSGDEMRSEVLDAAERITSGDLESLASPKEADAGGETAEADAG